MQSERKSVLAQSQVVCLLMIMGLAGVLAPQYFTSANATEFTKRDVPFRSILSDGRGFGVKICSDLKLKNKDDIKPKAWLKIQMKCSVYAMRYVPQFGKTKEPEIYSVCIGGALESCQRTVGVAEPCLNLKSCRASLGVP